LSKIPDEYLINILNEGLDYEIMISDISELETATKRDSKANQQALRVRLESKIYWFHLFEEEEKSIKYAKLFKGIRTNETHQRRVAKCKKPPRFRQKSSRLSNACHCTYYSSKCLLIFSLN